MVVEVVNSILRKYNRRRVKAGCPQSYHSLATGYEIISEHLARFPNRSDDATHVS
jgi:hypothetical protein